MVEPVIVADELALGPLGWLVDSDEVARVVVTDELAVVPRDWLVDKSVLGHNSAEGKGIPHAAQRERLVAKKVL